MPRRTKQDRSAYNREYSKKNETRLKAARRAWYRANKETILQKAKTYRAGLPEEIVRERRARWQNAHRVREKQRYQVTRAWLPWLNALRGSKQRAKRENIPFTLTKEWATERWTGKCEVTGIEFILSARNSPYLFSPSIDRIIPANGYTSSNARFVLHAVNALKGAGTDEDMLRIARAIVCNLELRAEKAIAPKT